LLEQRPGAFAVGEILFALIFLLALFQQTMFPPDTFERAMRDGQVELADQAAGAEGGKSFAELDELDFGGGRSTVVVKSRAAGLIPRCLALSTSRRRWL
jgi:hypothetical protein